MFNITENYNLKKSSSMPRRDLRLGFQTSVVAPSPSGGFVVKSSWGHPNSGSLFEEYLPINGGADMYMTATLSIGGKKEVTKQVYHKVDKWDPKFKWDFNAALKAAGWRPE